jgi:hypothetical protein
LLLNGQARQAKNSFEQSFLGNLDTLDSSEAYLTREFYRRHYWYWRVLTALELDSQATQIKLIIETAQDPSADVWKVRVANYHSANKEKDVSYTYDLIDSPESLFAYFEMAMVAQDLATVNRIRKLIPEEFWSYPDMKALEPKFQAMFPTSIPVSLN